MPRKSTTDHTIVIRVWVEPHDQQPRSRLIRLDGGIEVTAVGQREIEAAFATMLTALLAGNGA